MNGDAIRRGRTLLGVRYHPLHHAFKPRRQPPRHVGAYHPRVEAVGGDAAVGKSLGQRLRSDDLGQLRLGVGADGAVGTSRELEVVELQASEPVAPGAHRDHTGRRRGT